MVDVATVLVDFGAASDPPGYATPVEGDEITVLVENSTGSALAVGTPAPPAGSATVETDVGGSPSQGAVSLPMSAGATVETDTATSGATSDLRDEILAEAGLRASGDASLHGEIVAETARAEAAEAYLQSEIDALDADVASVRDPSGAGAVLVATAMAQAEARIAEVEAFIDTSVAAARENAAELFASADALFIATQGRLSVQAETAGADQLIAAVQAGMSARDLARKTAFAAAIAATAFAAGVDNERAWASSHQVLATTMAGNAAVAEERYAVQSTLNDSIAARLDSIDVAGATAAAGIADEAAARQSADLSIAASRSTAYAASSAEADRAAAQGFIDAINAGVVGRAQARAAAYALAVAQQATITQTTAEQALANYTQVVGARFGDVYASVQTQATAIAGINGQLAASYSIKVDANGNWAGLQIINGGGTINAIKLRADLLTLTLPGYSEQPVMGIATVGGVPTLAFNGNIIADNTLLNAAIGSVDLNPATSATAVGGLASVTVALKAGKPVQIIARSSAPAVNVVAAGGSITTTLKQGATTLDSDTAYTASDNIGNGICGSANLMAVYTPPTDGNYTFTVANAVSTTKAIVVLRTYKG